MKSRTSVIATEFALHYVWMFDIWNLMCPLIMQDVIYSDGQGGEQG